MAQCNGLLDLVEHAAIGEMRRLRLLPAAETSSIVISSSLGNRARLLRGDGRIARAVVILAR